MARRPKYTQRDLIKHILDLCDAIAAGVEGQSFIDFEKDRNLADATAYRLQAIGEACTKIDPGIKAAYNLPWKEIIGMRQILSHDYMAISKRVIWTTAQTNLDALRKACMDALENGRAE
ncbi:MAG: HepT-like ribonuclease domain-containing protein [Parvularculaceae bacterium]|nr:HepT-like ribonuclease domain-containing protein [Parvularculaceae bacterium]